MSSEPRQRQPVLTVHVAEADHDHDHDHDHDPPSTSHAHAHEHDGSGPSDAGGFPHEKLDAYRVALQMAVVAKRVADQIQRGHRSVADQLLRAASNSVLLLAEGANRRSAAEKRQRFVESRGEAGEVAAAADLVVALRLGPEGDAEELKQLAGRVAAMLTGLIARLL